MIIFANYVEVNRFYVSGKLSEVKGKNLGADG